MAFPLKSLDSYLNLHDPILPISFLMLASGFPFFFNKLDWLCDSLDLYLSVGDRDGRGKSLSQAKASLDLLKYWFSYGVRWIGLEVTADPTDVTLEQIRYQPPRQMTTLC